ncbi:MAG: Trp biosynthesis-associated membrane protein [Pseudonocardiaceae bacterium]
MPERVPSPSAPSSGARSSGALAATVVALVVAAALLGGAAALDWAQLDVQVPLRGIIQVRVDGSALLPVLGPLATLALAAVAAAMASAGWARWLLGAVLLAAAAPPIVTVSRVADGRWLPGAARAAVELPARSVPLATAALFAGPALAAVGGLLLAAAGVTLGVRGHRMPRLGRRYQAPAARARGNVVPQGRFWELMDADEDPTVSGYPR